MYKYIHTYIHISIYVDESFKEPILARNSLRLLRPPKLGIQYIRRAQKVSDRPTLGPTCIYYIATCTLQAP